MRTGQAARLLGITVKTLQRWEREGRLVAAAHCFSSRLYGLRNYRREVRATLESDHAAGASDQV